MNFCVVVVFGNFVIFSYLLNVVFEFFVVGMWNFFVVEVVMGIDCCMWVGWDRDIFVVRRYVKNVFVVFYEFFCKFFG